jgi:predicted transcriptional regulator
MALKKSAKIQWRREEGQGRGAMRRAERPARSAGARTRGSTPSDAWDRTGAGRVIGAAAIAALASPARQELVDTVEALGGAATIAELAAQLGRPADGLYYHVRRLVRAGLLVRDPDRGGDRYRTPGTRPLALDYRPADRRNAAAVRGVVGGMLRIARRDFDAGLALPGVVTHGAARALWAGRGKGWVGLAELAEVNALLRRVTALLRRPRRRGHDRLISVCFVLAPIAARPARRINARARARAPGRGSSAGGAPRRT